MRTLTHTIDLPSDADFVNLVYLTDTHLGAKACDEKLLQADIDAIKNTPNTVVLLGGDYIDAIARIGDKRYDTRTIADWLLPEHDVIGAQAAKFLEMIHPISHNCIGMVNGNHEHAAYRYYGYDVFGQMVRSVAQFSDRKQSDIEIGYQGFVVLKFRRNGKIVWKLSIYCSHGYGNSRLHGGSALTLGRAMGDFESDLVLMGHRHTRIYAENVVTAPKSNGHVVQRLRQGLFVPSYLNAFVQVSSKATPIDTYAEFFGLPPKHLGAVPIRITPDERQVSIMLNRKAGLKSALDGESPT
jgi:hypothetical protein